MYVRMCYELMSNSRTTHIHSYHPVCHAHLLLSTHVTEKSTWFRWLDLPNAEHSMHEFNVFAMPFLYQHYYTVLLQCTAAVLAY